MKRCLIKAVMISQQVNQTEAREQIIDAATNYHDRLQRGEHVSLAWEMEVDLEIEVDTELMNAMSDLVHEIRTERDDVIPAVKKVAEFMDCSEKDAAEYFDLSFEKDLRDEIDEYKELYEFAKNFSRDTFKNF